MKQNITLIASEQVAEGTTAFYFEKPAGFEFVAGQFGDYTLIDPPETDTEGNVRGFSFITAPHEDRIGFATRMRDTAFKRVLKTLQPGAAIMMDAPYGDIRLHNKAERAAIFLTGGIGITPVRSIVRDAAHRKLPHKIFVFYSNRRPEDAAFLKELQDLQSEDPNYKLIATMTQTEKSALPWNGEKGYIDQAMIERYVAKGADAIYYLTGPQAMVGAMRVMLQGAGVDADDIRTEEFSGY